MIKDIQITRRNYFLLRKIMKNPEFGSNYNTFEGQVYQHRFHNTVGDKLVMVRGKSPGTNLGERPLLYKNKFVVLEDEYSIDLFNYQYGFFFNSGEETFFRNEVKNKYHISDKKLDLLRAEGIEVIDKIKSKP